MGMQCTSPLCNCQNVSSAIQDVANELKRIKSWFNIGKLHLNAKKYISIMVHNECIQYVSNVFKVNI